MQAPDKNIGRSFQFLKNKEGYTVSSSRWMAAGLAVVLIIALLGLVFALRKENDQSEITTVLTALLASASTKSGPDVIYPPQAPPNNNNNNNIVVVTVPGLSFSWPLVETAPQGSVAMVYQKPSVETDYSEEIWLGGGNCKIWIRKDGNGIKIHCYDHMPGDFLLLQVIDIGKMDDGGIRVSETRRITNSAGEVVPGEGYDVFSRYYLGLAMNLPVHIKALFFGYRGIR